MIGEWVTLSGGVPCPIGEENAGVADRELLKETEMIYNNGLSYCLTKFFVYFGYFYNYLGISCTTLHQLEALNRKNHSFLKKLNSSIVKLIHLN